MATSPHGRKFICYSCMCRFYDLNRPKPICPKCGSDQSEAPEKPDIIDIAAKVLAATVSDGDEPRERYGPVADGMAVFDGDGMSDDDDDSDDDDSDDASFSGGGDDFDGDSDDDDDDDDDF